MHTHTHHHCTLSSPDSAAASGLVGGLHGLTASPGKRMGGLVALNCVQLQTMQKSVMNAFALKYSEYLKHSSPCSSDPPPPPPTEVSTGRSDVPYDSLQNLGVQVYGMPPEVPFHSPLLYNQQQLQQILANLEKIVFLKLPSHITTVCASELVYNFQFLAKNHGL